MAALIIEDIDLIVTFIKSIQKHRKLSPDSYVSFNSQIE